MEVSNDEFWRRLQAAARDADAAERMAHTDAEQLLAGVEPAPLAEAQIEAMVRAAIAPDETTVRQVGGPRAAAARSPAVLPMREAPARPIVQRVLAAVMALVMAPTFLTAATVGAAVYATSLVLRHTTKTLSYQEAIRIMLNEAAPEASRDAAQGTVYLQLVDAIEVLRTVTREQAALAAQASLILTNVRGALDAPPAFAQSHEQGTLDDLEGLVLDPDLSIARREAALERIAKLLDFGVAALLEMGGTELPADLKRDNDVVLEQLRSLVL